MNMLDVKLRSLGAPYAGEWIVIRISRFDDATTIPIDGEVVFHAPDAQAAYARSGEMKDLSTVLYVPLPGQEAEAIVIHR